jgi:hypothetical protein
MSAERRIFYMGGKNADNIISAAFKKAISG